MSETAPPRSFVQPGQPRILLVDDEPCILRALRRALSSHAPRWQITCARDGREALARLSEQPFHAVITDLQMPNIGGIELLKRLRLLHSETARIVHSSHVEAVDRARIDKLAHAVLLKPATAADIVARTTQAMLESSRTDPGSEAGCG